MISKKNFIAYVDIFKQQAFLIKTALIKAFTFSYLTKSSPPYNFKTNIINRISKSYTRTINSYFIITIIIFCLIAITASYYEQRYKFEQKLLSKTKFASLRIEENITNYQSSLDTLAQVILKDQRYLDKNKVIQLLKLTYTNDEHISLLPVAWRSMTEPNKFFNAHGSTISASDITILEKPDKNQSKFIIYDKLDKQGGASLVIVFPLLKQNITTQDNSLVGHLTLPIKASMVLQALYDSFAANDLLKVTRKDESAYFSKQQNSFNIIHEPYLQKYQFANDVSISNTPYTIAVGQNTAAIVENTIQTSLQRCGMILSLGIMMLLIYNFAERKKVKKQCDELFTEEVLLLKQQVEDLTTTLTDFSKNNGKSTEQIQSYHDAVKLITSIEQKIKQGYASAIDRIQDLLNFKHHKNNDELTIDIVKRVFDNIHALSENLRNNIAYDEEKITEVDLADIFTEMLTIFKPIISQRSITVINKIDDITIQINELILKQILITLFSKSLYFIPSNSNITISANKDISRNSVIIEISDNGIGFNELLFKDRSYQNKNDLIPNVDNIQLEHKTIETLVKGSLEGDLKIVSTRDGNQITLLFPIERDREDKVIPFPKILVGAKV